MFSLCDSVRVVAIALDFLLSTIIGSTCAGVLALFVVITSIYSYRRHNHIIATVKRPPYGIHARSHGAGRTVVHNRDRNRIVDRNRFSSCRALGGATVACELLLVYHTARCV